MGPVTLISQTMYTCSISQEEYYYSWRKETMIRMTMMMRCGDRIVMSRGWLMLWCHSAMRLVPRAPCLYLFTPPLLLLCLSKWQSSLSLKYSRRLHPSKYIVLFVVLVVVCCYSYLFRFVLLIIPPTVSLWRDWLLAWNIMRRQSWRW